MIVIVDYGLGNLGSIANMLKLVGCPATISSDPKSLNDASKIILPGVGAFDTGMNNLRSKGWIEPLSEKVLERKAPVLGICLGMQLMTEGSEEGQLPGLGWVKGYTKRFNFLDNNLKVPHMGWNFVSHSGNNDQLLKGIDEESRFYFVHSYYVSLKDESDELFKTIYGMPFSSGFAKDNIIGVQFHPEKSHKFGIHLFENFVKRY